LNTLNESGGASGDAQVYKRLMRFVLPYWRLFLVSTVGFAIYAATEPAVVMLIQHIIDSFQTDKRSEIAWLPFLFIGLFLVRGVGSFLGNYYLARISGNVVHEKELSCAALFSITTPGCQWPISTATTAVT